MLIDMVTTLQRTAGEVTGVFVRGLCGEALTPSGDKLEHETVCAYSALVTICDPGWLATLKPLKSLEPLEGWAMCITF